MSGACPSGIATTLSSWPPIVLDRGVAEPMFSRPRSLMTPDQLQATLLEPFALDRFPFRSHNAYTMTRAFLPSMQICQPADEAIVVAEVLSAA
jgi:hypothetical protein